MKTFASAAVLSMLLAGTALAQSASSDQQNLSGTGDAVQSSSDSIENQNGSTEMDKNKELDQSAAAPEDKGMSAEPGSSSLSGTDGGSASAATGGGTDQQAATESGTSGAASSGMSGSDAAMGGGSQAAASGGQDWQGDKTIVRQVQSHLKDNGYDVGALDGIYGPRTQQALRDFQKDKGHQVTGEIDQNLLAEMNIDSDAQTASTPRGDQSSQGNNR